MAEVKLKNVVKKYGDLEVVHGINLDITDGEFVVLVGPSGCAKSTTLRMVAGLEDISGGQIVIDDTVVNDVHPKDRQIAMVFQDYALYPHMTVRENMGFGLKMRGVGDAERDTKVSEAAKMLDLEPFLERKPAALSGGQRQRVAMGRAVVRKAKVFLFDEPLSNLDAKLRSEMRTAIKKLHTTLKTTTIYVTHDQIEAMTLADRIVIMKLGHIMQVGSPIEVYEQPANLFVATFIGAPTMNILDAEVAQQDGKLGLMTGGVFFPAVNDKWQSLLKVGQSVKLGLRPEYISLAEEAQLPAEWTYEATTVVSEIMGGTTQLEAKIGENDITAELQGRAAPQPGDKLKLALNLNRLHVFDAQTEQAIR